jgi:hypothetical protein
MTQGSNPNLSDHTQMLYLSLIGWRDGRGTVTIAFGRCESLDVEDSEVSTVDAVVDAAVNTGRSP